MKQKLAFITGIAGFAGSWLAEELLAKGYSVTGTILNGESTDNLQQIIKQIKLSSLDILKADQCVKLLNKTQPDYIFHLAAVASVGRSFDLEQQTFNVNFDGTLNMLQAARSVNGLKSFLFVGSADAYGIFKPKGKTLTEEQRFNPISPYGISKAAAEYACSYYFQSHKLPVMIARSFNHTGPRQTDNFAIPSFARQIAMIEKSNDKADIKVGDLSARRDISDVRDIVRGYHLISIKGKPGEIYHLCTGKSVSMQSLLNKLLSFSDKKIRVEIDPGRLRKSDIPILRGNKDKATQKLGYKTRYKINDTLLDTLNYWREEVGIVQCDCKKSKRAVPC